MTFAIDHIHAARECHDTQRRDRPGGHQERFKKTGQQQPEAEQHQNCAKCVQMNPPGLRSLFFGLIEVLRSAYQNNRPPDSTNYSGLRQECRERRNNAVQAAELDGAAEPGAEPSSRAGNAAPGRRNRIAGATARLAREKFRQLRRPAVPARGTVRVSLR